MYDMLHDAARQLEGSVDLTRNTRQRTALEAASKALDLLSLGLLRASEAANHPNDKSQYSDNQDGPGEA